MKRRMGRDEDSYMKFFFISSRKLIHSTASVGIFKDCFLWFPAGTDETVSHSITRTAKSNLNQLKIFFYLLLTLSPAAILTKIYFYNA